MTWHYTSPLEFKAPDVDGSGDFAGYLAVLNSVDLGGDALQPGCFADTLAETKARGAPLPVLWNHQPGVVLGKFVELREDGHGLFTRGKLTLATAQAREKYALLKDRAVTGLSIGYSIPDGFATFTNGVRLIHKIDLHEGSLVAVPMHPDARITDVKAALHPGELEDILRTDPRFHLSGRQAKEAASAILSIRRRAQQQDDEAEASRAAAALADQIKSITSLISKGV